MHVDMNGGEEVACADGEENRGGEQRLETVSNVLTDSRQSKHRRLTYPIFFFKWMDFDTIPSPILFVSHRI